ncbi:phage major capsid protein [Streptomyces sp. NPDC021080]|uniref:phage major capsid protein n=1 Tax=Streptomyces sp. NPDC021080 TaxID=3365110 RepID=UPI00379851EB
MIKPEIRKLLNAAEGEERGLNAREVAAVINSIPADERMARTEILAAVNGPNGPDSPETREAIAETLKFMELRAADAAEDTARAAFEAEARSLAQRAGGALLGSEERSYGRRDEGDEWRGLLPSGNEYRTLIAGVSPSAGGYAVPTTVADKWVEHLRNSSVFLKAPGINLHRFEGGSFVLPSLTSSSTPGVTAEGASIAESAATFAGLTFAPQKYADFYKASNEVISDASFDMRNLIAGVMTRNLAAKVDLDCFQGTGTSQLTGLTKSGVGTAVNLTVGNTVVKWDNVISAYSDIEGIGATPGVIWASPDMAKALRTERENSTNGGYLAGQVTDPVAKAGVGLPLLVSANLPAKTVIVADPTRVHIGVRSDVALAMSEDFLFDKDAVAFRATFRVAGLAVDNPAAVVVIKASAT